MMMPRHSMPIFDIVFIFGIITLFSGLYWQFHYGYQTSIDQDMAIRGAIGWIEHFPYLGATHWELRHPFVLSEAASILLFGRSEWSVLLPVGLTGVGTIILCYFSIKKLCNRRIAVIATVLFATSPLVMYASSVVMPGIFECFFFAMFLLLYANYFNEKNRLWSIILAGIAAGFGFLVRETYFQVLIGLVLFHAIYFRRDLFAPLIFAAAFVAVISSDLIFGYIETGNPIHRYIVDFQQIHPFAYWENTPIFAPTFDNTALVQEAYDRGFGQRWGHTAKTNTDHVGAVSLSQTFDLYILLFLNHEYGGQFFGLVFALVAVFLYRSGLNGQIKATVMFSLMIVSAFIFVNYALGTRPIPRYYSIMLLSSCALFGILLNSLLEKKKIVAVVLIVGMTLSGNLLGLDLRTPVMLGERTLAANPWHLTEPIYVQSLNALSSKFFLETAENPPEVRVGVPPPGGYYLHISDSTMWNTDRRKFVPGEDWREVWRLPAEERWAGQLLRLLSLQQFLPADLFRKLLVPDSTIILYQRNVG